MTNFDKLIEKDKEKIINMVATKFCIDPEKYKIMRPNEQCKYCQFGKECDNCFNEFECDEKALEEWLREEAKQ